MGEKIKRLGRGEAYAVTLIILVAFAGFGMGRLSKIEETRPEVVITEAFPEITGIPAMVGESGAGEENVTVGAAAEPMEKNFVGSKNGSKYHYPWCPGAQQMKEENKIWFGSREEAERAGYTPAANCKGL